MEEKRVGRTGGREGRREKRKPRGMWEHLSLSIL